MKRLLTIVLIIAFLSPLTAQASLPAGGVPRLESDARLETADFPRLALIVSGADDQSLPALHAKMLNLRDQLLIRVAEIKDEREKAESVLLFLYDNVLKRYSEYQTRVDTALVNGTYNCVSSAILYYWFASEAGLTVEGVETPDHSFCTVLVDGKVIDVETTNPYGVDPGTKKTLSGPDDLQQRYVLVPQTKYRNRHPVNERRLLSLAYSNRIAELTKRKEFALAVSLAVDSFTLQGFTSMEGDFASVLLNYAGNLSNEGSMAEGLEFIEDVESRWGSDPRFAAFKSTAAAGIITVALNDRDYDRAFALYEDYSPYLDDAMARTVQTALVFNYVQETVMTSPFDESLALTHKWKASLPLADYTRLRAWVYAREADRIAKGAAAEGKEAQWLAAAAVLDAALAEMPSNADLSRQRLVYRNNYAAVVHNRAAEAWNSGDKSGSRSMIEEGLRLVPESAVLKADLKRF